MNLRNLAFTAAMACALNCSSADVAWICQKDKHSTEFDLAFRNLSVEVDKYTCTSKGCKAEIEPFFEKIDGYGMVITSPLFNCNDKDWLFPRNDIDFSRIHRWIEDGGMLVVTDMQYGQIIGWAREIEPSVGEISLGGCTSGPWQVFANSYNVDPIDPIRGFPNVIKQADTWSHFSKAPEGWKTVTCCSEGKPVVLTKEIGKGLLVISVFRFVSTEAIENFYVNSKLRKTGLAVSSFSFPSLGVGPAKLSIASSSKVPNGTELYYTIESDSGEKLSLAAPFVDGKCEISFTNNVRGSVEAVMGVKTADGEKYPVVTRHAEIPKLFTLKPNAYRGILSTKRRKPTVDFKMELAPSTEDLHGAKAVLTVVDEDGNEILTAKHTVEAKGPIAPSRWVPLALKKDLKPGEYTLRGVLTKEGTALEARSETKFKILAPHPAQTIIDEDGTFLVNGQPFFPMGIYHLKGEYDKVASLGFNACQYWMWDDWDDQYGVPRSMRHCDGLGMKLLYEGLHNDNIPHRARARGKESAMLMWYLADEAMEDSVDNVRFRNAAFHKADPDHPTFLLSCREDLFEMQVKDCDVFATNAGSPAGQKSDGYEGHLAVLDSAQKAGDWHKAIIDIPGGFDDDIARHHFAIYAGLVHNVRGFFYYCWNQVGGGPVGLGLHNFPNAQEGMSNTLSQVKMLIPGLTSVNRRTFKDGPIHGMVCGDKDAKGKRFVILVNVSTNKFFPNIVLPELARVPLVKNPFNLEEETEIFEGRIVDPLGPHQERVYCW